MDILKKEICFLSKDKMYCTKGDKKFNKELILSPYYYWYFEKKLPVTNIKRAKAIVSQMLESSLPTDKNFQFILRQKEKNVFDIFVLDYDLLISKLNTLGIEKERISSISFSHLEFEESYIELDDTILLSFQDSVAEISNTINYEVNLLKIDIHDFLKNKQKLSFKYSFSKGNLLQKTIDFLDTSFIPVASVFILLISSLMIQLFTSQNILKINQEKKENLLKTQTYATHSVQLKYVMDEMLQIDFKQKNLKNSMKKLTKINANATTYIAKVEYDDGDWFLDVVAPDKTQADNLIKNNKFSFVREDKNIFKYEKVK
ncbi:MAG: hypothetical protein WBG69_04385 [Arcobacteraceae bacterium]